MKLCLYVDKIKNFLLDILFPVSCLGCGLKDEILCDNCLQKINHVDRQTEENIVAMFDYREPLVKKAIWELKYHHKRYLGEKLGQLLYEFLLEDIADMKTIASGQPICVIPVPISIKKTRVRGYNQTEAIAKGFCQSSLPGVFELNNKVVVKNRETLPQAKISNRNKRLKNIHGVFELKNTDTVKGRTIIVIDDVTTTGGTISEIIKILKKAEAKRIVGFAVAH
jgi:ComF family protein